MVKKYTADFETTTNLEDIRIWAYGICEIGDPENFIYGTDMEEFMGWCSEGNPIIYFHNLKFDGMYIIDWLERNGFTYSEEKRNKTYNCIISKAGQFYQIEVIFEKKSKRTRKVTFYDSFKKLSFSVDKVAKAFKLPLNKLEIDYKKERPVGYKLTDHEIDYLRADVEIMARALEIQFDKGLTKMTTGSDALHNFKEMMGEKEFKRTFPVLKVDIDKDIRQAYRGGFTYLNEKYKGKDVSEGIVLDVHSMYPGVMYNKYLPFGKPLLFRGKYKKDNIYTLYIQMFTCEFKLKDGKIPTVQLKNNLAYQPTDYVKESKEPTTLCMTNIDVDLFFDHYEVKNIEWHSGWKFKATKGIFKDYIDYWYKVKEENSKEKGALYNLAKLMLNALYGKFATNPDVTGKYPVMENNKIKLKMKKEKEMRDPVYTAMGVFITSYARDLVIRSAQSVYPRFIYADTDSLHLEGKEIPKEITVTDNKLGTWGFETSFERGRFIRAKTYIEEIYDEEKDKLKLKVTCAGMPDRVKEKVTWDNFRSGLKLDGKLVPKVGAGGVILEDTTFTIK
ncbi:DNA polymerase [Bacillus altitudinis]|uniref:DNA polymerase n=1 Tax=Bacillus altitudinis TaxID=293387 RepID=UPI003D20F4DA